MTRLRAAVSIASVLAVLAAAGWYTLLRPSDPVVVSADFVYVNGIFPGSGVDILGVPVGRVTAVQPQGAMVRVTMSLPAGTRVPASAQAYIMSPAVISDQFVRVHHLRRHQRDPA